MSTHRLLRFQHVNAPLSEVWQFFSAPTNLARISPEYMNFRVTSGELPDEIYPGQIITYSVAPLLRIPLFWMTEITHVIPNKLFVDEQRRGPYAFWHHEHLFTEAAGGGVDMRDLVYYRLPLGFVGDIAHALFVHRQLNEIFEYRSKKIREFFP